MVHVNYLAVLVAAVAVFVLGWLWYSPLLFYKPWMRLRGMDPVAAMAGAKMPGGKLLIELVRCLVLAYVIARIVSLLRGCGRFGAEEGHEQGALVGADEAPDQLGAVQERKRRRLNSS